MQGFRVTYEIVTPESAEQGENDEIGFILPGERRTPIAEALKDESNNFEMNLRSALNLVCPSYDCGRWFEESDARHDYTSGESENRALHPPRNITESSYRRLKRLLKIKG